MAGTTSRTTDEHAKRSQALRNSLIYALGAVVLWLAVATASSLYGGTGRDESLDSREQNVTATVVGPCHRQGTISLNGLGYWWTCRATVGSAAVELRHSVATETDIGRGVQVHELCTKQHHTGCRYGRVDRLGVAGIIEALHVIELAILPLLLFAAGTSLTRYFLRSTGPRSLY